MNFKLRPLSSLVGILVLCNLMTGCILSGDLEFNITELGQTTLGLPAGNQVLTVSFSDAASSHSDHDHLRIGGKELPLENSQCIVRGLSKYECTATSSVEGKKLNLMTKYYGPIGVQTISEVKITTDADEVLLINTKPQPFWH